jgi:hypothetical protein
MREREREREREYKYDYVNLYGHEYALELTYRLAFGSWLPLIPRKPCSAFCPSLARGA